MAKRVAARIMGKTMTIEKASALVAHNQTKTPKGLHDYSTGQNRNINPEGMVCYAQRIDIQSLRDFEL